MTIIYQPIENQPICHSFGDQKPVNMEEILANVDDITFEIERQIENQIGLLPLPFPSMDKSGAAICQRHLQKICDKGNLCPLRHTGGDQTVVCKHWLRGLCKKGDSCEFLHVYDMSKMPECYFYSKFNACTNKECTFLHIDPSTKKKDCPWYDRGFCRHGPNCRHKHTKRVMCVNYLAGFCPLGPECRHVHPKLHNFNPAEQTQDQAQHGNQYGQSHHPHHNHHQRSHNHHQIPTIQQTHHMAQHQQMNLQAPMHQSIQQIPVHQNMHHQPMGMMPRKPIHQVVCYKCGMTGHYANRCWARRGVDMGFNGYDPHMPKP